MIRLSLIMMMLWTILGCENTAAQDRRADRREDATSALQRGQAAYERKDYTTALRAWQPLAQQGNATAQRSLGVMYEHGRGVAKDEAEAVRLYSQAAAQGEAKAQTNLGGMYAQGRGVAKDEAEAVRLYRQAAAQGDVLAQTNLGVMYAQGQGVAKDEAEAVRLYRQAAAQGNARAQNNLGAMYSQGRGVAGDQAEAARLYSQAAAQGLAIAQRNLGARYEQGRGVTRDLAEAQRWFARAAETFPPGSERDKAIQARDRVARLLSTHQTSTISSASDTPPAPVPVAPLPPLHTGHSPGQNSSRRALVIGNAAYPDNPLANPVNDATDMANLLRRFGFATTLLSNVDQPTMERAVDVFTQEAPRGSVGLFFFAGHGVQIEGVNYLVPLGVRLNAASDVKYHAVATDWVLARMEESGMDVKLLILDACRDNPLGRSLTRALSRGLAVIEAPKGSLVVYATSPGKTARDGVGRNSPFTTHLLRELPVPGRPVELAFKAVRVGVQKETNGEQIPWEASSLTGDLVFTR